MDDHNPPPGLPGSRRDGHPGPAQPQAASDSDNGNGNGNGSLNGSGNRPPPASTPHGPNQALHSDLRDTQSYVNVGAGGDSPMPDAYPSTDPGPTFVPFSTAANTTGAARIPTAAATGATFGFAQLPLSASTNLPAAAAATAAAAAPPLRAVGPSSNFTLPPPPLDFSQPSSSSSSTTPPTPGAHHPIPAAFQEALSQVLGPLPPSWAPPAPAPPQPGPPSSSAISAAWQPIPEDLSLPGIDELSRLETNGEVSALDHAHWQATGFVDLHDLELIPLDTGTITFTISAFNGTRESPNDRLVMHSHPVEIDGRLWRIKVFPKGRGGNYVAAYVECLTFSNSHHPSWKPVLPPLGERPDQPPDCVPAQVILIMYNPEEPRVNYSRATHHSFSRRDADVGWRHFGSAPRHELGKRAPDTRQPMLRNDKLAFVAHVRVHNDPTLALFLRNNPDSITDDSKTGLCPVADVEDRRGLAPNLTAAILVFCLIPHTRQFLYVGHNQDRPHTPLLDSLVLFLSDLRRTHTNVARLERVANALGFRGFPTTTLGCGSHRCRHGDLSGLGPLPRVIWHPFGRSMENFDVVQLIEMMIAQLRAELMHGVANWVNQPSSEPMRSRIKVPLCTRSSVLTEVQRVLEAQAATADLVLVELPRLSFDDDSRVWQKNTDRVQMPEKIDVSPQRGLVYSLTCLVSHDGDTSSRAFTALVRSDGGSWLQFSKLDPAQRVSTATWLTKKQALEDKVHSIYLAIYTRANTVTYSHVPHPPAVGVSPETILNKPPASAPELSPQEVRMRTGPQSERAEGDYTTDCLCPRPAYFEKDWAELVSRHRNATVDYFGSGFYQGDLERGFYSGDGRVIYANGNEYSGQFSRGLPDGNGTMVWREGGVYSGGWKHGQMHGHGVVADPMDGTTYQDTFENGRRNGLNSVEGVAGAGQQSREPRLPVQFPAQPPDRLPDRNAERSDVCLICFERERNAVFVPCGHLAVCEDCAREMMAPGLPTCPYCRVTIRSTMRVFRP